MNRTQKGAWFTLGLSVLLLLFEIIIFEGMFTPGSRTAGTKLVRVWIWFILVFMACGAAIVHWKRGASSVDFDERDNSIKKNAVSAAFVSLWALLFITSIIPYFVVGQEGAMSVCLLPIVNFSVFMIAAVIYSVAILIQYRRGNKGELS